ncbi:MAG: transglycosylase SLT domain-containing protein [Myxococcota bacterium]
MESNYNHLAISPVGAEGLMQLMPPTAAWTANKYDLQWPEQHSFDPELNVRLGARYLALLTREFKGHMDLALTAYNRGPSATRYILGRHGRLPKDVRDFYATKVLDKYSALKHMYGHLM